MYTKQVFRELWQVKILLQSLADGQEPSEATWWNLSWNWNRTKQLKLAANLAPSYVGDGRSAIVVLQCQWELLHVGWNEDKWGKQMDEISWNDTGQWALLV